MAKTPILAEIPRLMSVPQNSIFGWQNIYVSVGSVKKLCLLFEIFIDLMSYHVCWIKSWINKNIISGLKSHKIPTFKKKHQNPIKITSTTHKIPFRSNELPIFLSELTVFWWFPRSAEALHRDEVETPASSPRWLKKRTSSWVFHGDFTTINGGKSQENHIENGDLATINGDE